jgi:hypothetical protein
LTQARARTVAVAGAVALAVVVLFLPWYALGDYVPNGWDATWLARLALAAGVAAALVLRLGGPARVAAALWLIALALVAVRVAFPPDFGFGFDGLDVPVERRAGSWAGLATALLGTLAAWWAARARPAAHVAPGP